MTTVGILGGAGYTAGELVRLLINHSKVTIDFVFSTSNAGNQIGDVHQDLAYLDMKFTDTINGQISRKLSGTSGFGYDPLFIPEGQDVSMAELGSIFKNKHSHRAKAFKALIQTIL